MTGTTNRAAKATAVATLSAFIFFATSVAVFAKTPIAAGLGASADGLLLAQAATAPSTTNPAPATSAQPAHRPHHRMSAHRHGMGPPDPVKDVEARISDMHKRLSITPDQEPQFKTYVDVLRSNAQAMHDLFQERAQAGGESALDRLHWYAKLTSAHADAVNKLVPPFEALYQSLSDKQKKAADAEFRQIRQRRPAHRSG
jgi:hypothetical protein